MRRRGIGIVQEGFALPTVMVVSIVMLIVLLSGLVSASSTNTAIRAQYQDKILAQAVESGAAMANACLSKSNQVVTWSDTNPLRPNTNCSGVVITAAPVPSAYILDTTSLKTSFEVKAPDTSDGTQRAAIIGKILTSRSGGGSLERTVTSNALVGGQPSFSNIAFGYYSGDGAHFAVVLPTGEVKGVGTNNNGRLGNGTTTNTLTPSAFILPVGKKGAAAYTNFLSLGLNLYVQTQDGDIYGAGNNEAGQLGNGTVTGIPGFVWTPVKFNLPNGVKGTFVAGLQQSTFVITDSGNIYAAGACSSGQLGINNGSCTNVSSPTRVNLPPVTSDPNTIPVSDPGWVQPMNMNADRLNMYVRMQGGAAYGWGINDYGQLGTGDTTQANSPVRLRALGTSGTPATGLVATQLAFNGTTSYVLDDAGQVWAAGTGETGEMLGAGVNVQNSSTLNCLRKDPGTSNLIESACGKLDGWEYMEYWPDSTGSYGTLRFRTNSYSYLPTDSMLCAHVASQYGTVTMQTCNGSANQQWQFDPDGKLYNPTFFTCARSKGTGNVVPMATCSQSADFFWKTTNSLYYRPVPRPPYDATLGRYPKYIKITTDNRATMLLDENGTVWGAGGNNRYQLGTGNVGIYNPILRKVNLPGGIKAVDIYMTETNPYGPLTGVNTGSYSNGYIIGADGSVYGSGANNFGQLGNGTTSDYGILVKMNLPAGVMAKSVQSGFGTTVVLSTGGVVYTVGNNASGQLGNGTTDNSSTPKANKYTNQRQNVIY